MLISGDFNGTNRELKILKNVFPGGKGWILRASDRDRAILLRFKYGYLRQVNRMCAESRGGGGGKRGVFPSETEGGVQG